MSWPPVLCVQQMYVRVCSNSRSKPAPWRSNSDRSMLQTRHEFSISASCWGPRDNRARDRESHTLILCTRALVLLGNATPRHCVHPRFVAPACSLFTPCHSLSVCLFSSLSLSPSLCVPLCLSPPLPLSFSSLSCTAVMAMVQHVLSPVASCSLSAQQTCQ